MKKTFQKSLIAASVGALLATASMVASAGTPGTTNLLFPYVTSKVGAYTFLSITNQLGAPGPTPLHFTWATKAIGAANSAACNHVNGDAMSTPNDLMQFEMSNRIDVPAAFGDTTSAPKYFPGAPAGSNQQGFLIVNNSAAAAYGEAAAYNGAILHGDAHIIDTSTGLYFAYSTDDLHTTDAALPDFALAAGPDGANPNKVMSWYATSVATTSFYILPLADEGLMAYAGAATVTYAATGPGPLFFYGHYNNNEGFQSSTTNVPVTCFGVASRAQMLGALNEPWSANGGWANWFRVGGAATNALVYKQETTLNSMGSYITRAPTL